MEPGAPKMRDRRCTFVSHEFMFHTMSQFPIVWTGTPRQGACCWCSHPFNSLAQRSHWDEGACCALWASRCDFRDPGWRDPGFPQREVLFLRLLRANLTVFVFVLACFTRWPVLISAHKCVNLHRVLLSNMTMFSCFLCCVFCCLLLLFWLCVVWLFLLFSGLDLPRKMQRSTCRPLIWVEIGVLNERLFNEMVFSWVNSFTMATAMSLSSLDFLSSEDQALDPVEPCLPPRTDLLAETLWHQMGYQRERGRSGRCGRQNHSKKFCKWSVCQKYGSVVKHPALKCPGWFWSCLWDVLGITPCVLGRFGRFSIGATIDSQLLILVLFLCLCNPICCFPEETTVFHAEFFNSLGCSSNVRVKSFKRT